ncbi:hypothetical protein V2J09_016484 [Rumex salicifolius]
MGLSLLLRSTRRAIQCSLNNAISKNWQEHLAGTPFPSRWISTEAEAQSFKGHSMLAPFTAGWQTTDSHPLVIEKSEGCYVYDTEGNKYLDALAALWCTALGGNEPRLVAAATEQLNKLPFYHSFWNRTTKPSLDLAKELLDTFTARKMEKVFFVNSGSEANDTQVKLVWYYNNALGRPNKKKFIARSKSYHGSTLIAASLSGLPALHHQFDLPAPFVLHTDCPHYWRFHLPGETEEEFATRLANNLEKLILKEGPETNLYLCENNSLCFHIAAFIAEPVMGAGGVITPPATYFDKIQAVVKKYDILFIADEVICAFGRLGEMYGCDKFNIKPDLVSVAKALSSGYMPIGALLVSPEVSEVIYSQSNKLGTESRNCPYNFFATTVLIYRLVFGIAFEQCKFAGSFSHGFTYSGHPVSCAVAIEALRIYKEINIVQQVRDLSPKFQEGIKAYAVSPIVGEIRGTGLILGCEFTDNKSPNDPFPVEWGKFLQFHFANIFWIAGSIFNVSVIQRVGAYFGAQCQKHGMLVRVSGDNIMICPPLIISEGELDQLITTFGKALKDTEEYVKELKSLQN